jgi:hypothetical protein
MTENRAKSTNQVSIGDAGLSGPGSSSILGIGGEIIKNSSVHSNVAQEFIVTTADKVTISLIEHRAALKAQNDWRTPVGILLAILPTLVAADFKPFLGLEPSVWQAMFILGSLICLLRLAYAFIQFIQLREKSDIEYVIKQLKKSSQETNSK